MKLVEQEILQKVQAALGDDILTYYMGEVLVPPQNYLPALMVFGTGSKISARDTLKDQIESSVTIRVVFNVMANVREKGSPRATYIPVSGGGGTFQVGETVTGITSSATATLATKSSTNLQLEYVTGSFTNEVVLGSTSGATTVAVVGQESMFIETQYKLRQAVEGRDPDTGLFKANSIMGAIRSRTALRGNYYYYTGNVNVTYKTLASGDFFYVTADITLSTVSDLVARPTT